VQRHLHLGRARPQRAPAGLDQRHQERRPPRRPRRLPDQGQGDRAFAARAGPEEGDREEAAEGGLREEGREGELRRGSQRLRKGPKQKRENNPMQSRNPGWRRVRFV
jgi:hypothetical protein